MNRRERNTSPTPSERLRYDYVYNTLRHRPFTAVQKRVVVTPPRDRFKPNMHLFEKFDLLTDDAHDDDTIFSEDSSYGNNSLPSHGQSRFCCNTDTNHNAPTVRINENYNNIECSLISNGQRTSARIIPSLHESNRYTFTSVTLRKKLAEAALFEAMSGPGRRMRHTQSTQSVV